MPDSSAYHSRSTTPPGRNQSPIKQAIYRCLERATVALRRALWGMFDQHLTLQVLIDIITDLLQRLGVIRPTPYNDDEASTATQPSGGRHSPSPSPPSTPPPTVDSLGQDVMNAGDQFAGIHRM